MQDIRNSNSGWLGVDSYLDLASHISSGNTNYLIEIGDYRLKFIEDGFIIAIMIEHGVQKVLDQTKSIEKVLRQAGDHQEVSVVETGNALGLLEEWRQSLEEIKKISAGINLRDIELTEEFLDKNREECPSIRNILDQQRKLAALQNMETSAIQESLEGTGVSFGVPVPFRVGKFVTDRGYILYTFFGKTLWPEEKLGHSDLSIGISEHHRYLVDYQEDEWYGFLGMKKRKVTRQKKMSDIKLICTLYNMRENPWKMGIWGTEVIPEALFLARGLRELMKGQIEIKSVLLSEDTLEKRGIKGWIFEGPTKQSFTFDLK